MGGPAASKQQHWTLPGLSQKPGCHRNPQRAHSGLCRLAPVRALVQMLSDIFSTRLTSRVDIKVHKPGLQGHLTQPTPKIFGQALDEQS